MHPAQCLPLQRTKRHNSGLNQQIINPACQLGWKLLLLCFWDGRRFLGCRACSRVTAFVDGPQGKDNRCLIGSVPALLQECTDSGCGLELNVCPGKTTPPHVTPKFPCKKLSVFISYDTKKRSWCSPKACLCCRKEVEVLVPP